MPSQRNPWVDVTKGFTITSVVVYHAASLTVDDGASAVWYDAKGVVAAFGMPVFFMMSGLFVSRHITLPWPDFLRIRVWPMVYLWVAWTTLYALVHVVTGGRAGSTLREAITLHTIMWYLAALALYLLVARATRSVNPAVQLGVATLIAIPAVTWLTSGDWGVRHTPHYYIAFLIGVLYTKQLRAWSGRVTRGQLALVLAAVIAVAGSTLFVPATRDVIAATAAVVGVPAALVLTHGFVRWSPSARLLGSLGAQSLAIYLIHPLVLSAVGWVLGDTSSRAAVVYPAAGVVAAVTVGWAIGTALGRRARWVFAEPQRPRPVEQRAPAPTE